MKDKDERCPECLYYWKDCCGTLAHQQESEGMVERFTWANQISRGVWNVWDTRKEAEDEWTHHYADEPEILRILVSAEPVDERKKLIGESQ